MVESNDTLCAGWAKTEIVLSARYPMAGYLARKRASRGTLDPLFVRALVLRQGRCRVCIVIADILLISPTAAARLQKQIAKVIGTPARHVIVAATHTHSGPLVESGPFRLSHGKAGERLREFMRELEEIFVQTAVAARNKLQSVRASYSRTLIHGLATDRNHPEKNRIQPFVRVHLETIGSSAVFGILPCHPTVLGAANLGYSGDLHGEIARRYERQFNVALIANGACANISTRFTRRSQTQSQVSRFASLVISQAESSPFRTCASAAMSIASQAARLPVKNFRKYEGSEKTELTGRLADVAREGKSVAAQFRQAPEFRRKNISINLTCLRLGPVSFTAFPLELYAETGRFLWTKARTAALCYANGYWGYVYIPKASKADYEVLSSPFAASADKLLLDAVLDLTAKTWTLDQCFSTDTSVPHLPA